MGGAWDVFKKTCQICIPYSSHFYHRRLRSLWKIWSWLRGIIGAIYHTCETGVQSPRRSILFLLQTSIVVSLLFPGRWSVSGWSRCWEALFGFHSKAKEMGWPWKKQRSACKGQRRFFFICLFETWQDTFLKDILKMCLLHTLHEGGSMLTFKSYQTWTFYFYSVFSVHLG